MKTCPNCNKTYEDEYSFCESCGSRLEEQSGEVIENNPDQRGLAQTVNSPDHLAQDKTSSSDTASLNQSTSAQSPPASKKASPVKKILIVCAAIGILYFIVSQAVLAFNPTYKLLKGLSGLYKDKSTMSATVSFDYKGDASEAKIIDDITLKAETAADLDNFFAESSLEFLYDNKSVTKIALGVNNEDLYIDLLKLYNKKLYQELDSLIPDFKENINDLKIIKKALKDVSIKADARKYANIVEEALDDDIKSSLNKITVKLEAQTAAELWESLIDEAADDKKLMESVRKNGISFVKRLLKERKSFEFIDEDALDEALEVLEDKDEFEEYYQEILESASGSFGYLGSMNDYSDAIPEFEMTFKFGLFNQISGIDYRLNVEDSYSEESIKINVRTEISNGVKFTKYNKKDAIEIQELLEDGDLEEVAETIIKNLVKAIKGNKKLVGEIEDITGYDIDDLEDEAMDYLLDSLPY